MDRVAITSIVIGLGATIASMVFTSKFPNAKKWVVELGWWGGWVLVIGGIEWLLYEYVMPRHLILGGVGGALVLLTIAAVGLFKQTSAAPPLVNQQGTQDEASASQIKYVTNVHLSISHTSQPIDGQAHAVNVLRLKFDVAKTVDQLRVFVHDQMRFVDGKWTSTNRILVVELKDLYAGQKQDVQLTSNAKFTPEPLLLDLPRQPPFVAPVWIKSLHRIQGLNRARIEFRGPDAQLQYYSFVLHDLMPVLASDFGLSQWKFSD